MNKHEQEKVDNMQEWVKNLLKDNTTLGTQEELVRALEKAGFSVTQSSVSRVLRKLGANKVIHPSGKSIYQLPQEAPPLERNARISALIVAIEANETTIVIHTSPGSASLIAALLDRERPGNILGTIAGDDTLIVIPDSIKHMEKTVKAIKVFLG